MAKSTKLPLPLTRLRLGATESTVTFPKSLRQSQLAGTYNAETHAIEIRADLPPSEAFITLLHEILHYCWTEGNIHAAVVRLCGVDEGEASQLEEYVVRVTARELARVMRDNQDTLQCLAPLWNTVLFSRVKTTSKAGGKR